MLPRTAEFYHSLPKVELHRHLEGSLRLETLIDIAGDYALEFPGVHDLRPLVQVVQTDERTSRNFLSKFEVLRKFYRSPEIIKRITEEAIADAAEDNIRYLELRFTPAALGKINSYSFGDILDWVIEGTEAAQEKYRIMTRLLVSVNRHESLELAEHAAQEAADRIERGIVGLDLAGNEASSPTPPFEGIFREAQQSGLLTTIHAGEWGPAENVFWAIEHLKADRIGHGVRVVENPEVVAMAREKGTIFEVCPTSNYQSGIVPDPNRHPIQDMVRLGLNATVNTDDPGISQITLSEEYALVCDRNGLSVEKLQEQVLTAAQAAFLPSEEREKLAASLKAEFDGLILSP